MVIKEESGEYWGGTYEAMWREMVEYEKGGGGGGEERSSGGCSRKGTWTGSRQEDVRGRRRRRKTSRRTFLGVFQFNTQGTEKVVNSAN
eukprot:761450-Hanusia_phi.AAC.1